VGLSQPESLPSEEPLGLMLLERFKAQLGAMGFLITAADMGYTMNYPAYSDRDPSFSFREVDDGKLLVHH
jgi:hypothetical protein